MSDTASLKLPLLQPSQAQKHVTVNEALVRLDGLVQLQVQSLTQFNPPLSPAEGACYGIPTGAGAAWGGSDGDLAIYSNGGWIFVAPQAGWQGWVVETGQRVTWLNGGWVGNVMAGSGGMAHAAFSVIEVEHLVQAGGAQDVALPIPADSLLFACSARVVEDLTGTLTTWQLGTTAQADQFGSGMGLSAGSYCTGLLGTPFSVYSETLPRLMPVGGTFTGGRVRVAAHFYRIGLP